MRTTIIAIAGLAFTLTACGEGGALDEGVKTGIREKVVMTCTATAEGQIPAGITIDIDQLCGCAADKIVEGKSVAELVSNPPGTAEAIAKVQQCLTELAPVKIEAAK